jgi:hypothetical protein
MSVHIDVSYDDDISLEVRTNPKNYHVCYSGGLEIRCLPLAGERSGMEVINVAPPISGMSEIYAWMQRIDLMQDLLNAIGESDVVHTWNSACEVVPRLRLLLEMAERGGDRSARSWRAQRHYHLGLALLHSVPSGGHYADMQAHRRNLLEAAAAFGAARALGVANAEGALDEVAWINAHALTAPPFAAPSAGHVRGGEGPVHADLARAGPAARSPSAHLSTAPLPVVPCSFSGQLNVSLAPFRDRDTGRTAVMEAGVSFGPYRSWSEVVVLLRELLVRACAVSAAAAGGAGDGAVSVLGAAEDRAACLVAGMASARAAAAHVCGDYSDLGSVLAGRAAASIDIHEHLPELVALARQGSSVLELGVRGADSSWAFLHGLVTGRDDRRAESRAEGDPRAVEKRVVDQRACERERGEVSGVCDEGGARGFRGRPLRLVQVGWDRLHCCSDGHHRGPFVNRVLSIGQFRFLLFVLLFFFFSRK